MRIIKQSLVVRVTDQLMASIQEGEWVDWLPCEKDLSKDFGVSRTTLRQALERLRDNGVIETQQGKNSRIRKGAVTSLSKKETRPNVVTLLSPSPMGRLRQHTLLWIDELRSLLHDADLSLNFLASRAPNLRTKTDEVKKLIQQHRSFAWVLLWSVPETQMAFAQCGAPAVVVGATVPEIPLPSVSVDNQAIAFHAVGLFTSKGHRSIALVAPKKSTVGNRVIEESFKRSVALKGKEGLVGQVIKTDECEPEKLLRQLRRTRKQANPPRAFLFIHPLHLLTAYNALQSYGVRIPADVSLVSAFADQSFDFLSPKPAYYRMDPEELAKKLFAQLEWVGQGGAARSETRKLVPELINGESVGRGD